MQENPRLDTVLLGCTHFPVLIDALSAVAGAIDFNHRLGRTTAAPLADDLRRQSIPGASSQR